MYIEKKNLSEVFVDYFKQFFTKNLYGENAADALCLFFLGACAANRTKIRVDVALIFVATFNLLSTSLFLNCVTINTVS